MHYMYKASVSPGSVQQIMPSFWYEHESVGAEGYIVRAVPRTTIHEVTVTKIFCVILGNRQGILL
jgi:hypothetical protein